MTDAIPLDQLGASSDDDKRRDRWGRLLVVPPGASEPAGYTRVTTVAKTCDDGGGLMPWKATMATVGAMLRPGLRAKWEALISAHAGDPWYASAEAKAACKRLVEESAEAGGATNRRDQGLALHAITARLDAGEELHHLTPETERDVDAYRAALIDAGVRLMPEFVEQTVVLDGWQVGGTFDRLVDVKGFDLPLIADLKTGEDLSYSWHSFAVQLAGYAHADDLYDQGLAPSGSDDVRTTMPEVDQEHGLVIHLPAGGARCSLHIVDLTAGWQGFELSMAVRDWRKRKGLASLLDEWQPPAVEQLADLAQRDQEALEPSLSEAETRAWLQGRLDVIGRHPEARQTVGQLWPAGMPTLKSSTAHTADDLAAIEAVLVTVEARHGIGFGPGRPAPKPEMRESLARLLGVFPNSTITKEPTP